MRHPNIFIIGDTAHVAGHDGTLFPAAKQQGIYVVNCCARGCAGRTLPPFRYRDFGSLATIGRKSAVMELGRILKGFVAWVPGALRTSIS